MISGYAKINEQNNLFEYENKLLKIKYEGEDCINNDFNLLKCKKFPHYNDIYFYKQSNYFLYNGLSEQYPDLVIDFNDKYSGICVINFELEELDMFYNKDLTNDNFDFLNVSGEVIIKSKSFDEMNSKEYKIKVKDKEMLMQIIVGQSFDSSSANPLTFNKKIKIVYDFNDNYSLIYETIKLVKKLMSFISYRKNIVFRSITIQSRNRENLLYRIGTIEYIDKSFIERKTNTKYIKEHSYFYENICDYLGILFNKISSEDFDLLNIPKDDYMINIYKEERVLMITSSFEDLFKLIYNDKIEHSESSIEMRKFFSDYLTKCDETIEFKNMTYKKFWDKLKKHVLFDNFSSKLNEVLRRDNFIDNIVRELYEKNSKTYERYKVTQRIEKIRNKCAHGEYRKNAEDNDYYCIKALELVVYYLQLKFIGVDKYNINVIFYRVFRISLRTEILEELSNL